MLNCKIGFWKAMKILNAIWLLKIVTLNSWKILLHDDIKKQKALDELVLDWDKCYHTVQHVIDDIELTNCPAVEENFLEIFSAFDLVCRSYISF